MEELDFVFDSIEWGWCVVWVLLLTNKVSMFAGRPGYRETWFFWAKRILCSLISYWKNCFPWLSLKKTYYWPVIHSLRLFHGRQHSQHSKCSWTTTSLPWHSPNIHSNHSQPPTFILKPLHLLPTLFAHFQPLWHVLEPIRTPLSIYSSKLCFWLCDTVWHYRYYGTMDKGNVTIHCYRHI